ncbi:Morn repeat protein [Pandoravirus kuranda]|uniref:Morn repeat protein n=1 Tax=Pandoravirus kuranda TaxID=3019033 RepID=A0AA95J3V4_9VIRU|nr:Morn repeat protein [Pandoravirus kuranda]
MNGHGDDMADACLFDLLPDEVVIEILIALGGGDVGALSKWAMTCRRHAVVAADPTLWKRLYEKRFGDPYHRRFESEGKDWRWLYRARACVVGAATADRDPRARVGTVKILQQDAEWTYWGDLLGVIPDGYGLALPQDPATCPPLWIDGRAVVATARDRYEGHWKCGQRHGRGIETLQSGGSYDGDWEANERHGHGTYTWSDASVHIGQWQHGDRHGHGSARYADGDWYDGDWVRGHQHGYGSYTHANGARYDGQWENGLPHGYGEETSLDGMTYYGLYRCGKRCGYGVATQDGVTIYRGQWANDKIAGYGVARYADGATWCGWSVDGAKCGYGVYRWPDGTEYAGLFEADQPCDSGVYVTPSGERTVVVGGDPGAHAVVTRPDGFTYTGGWSAGLGSFGQGTCTYSDGSCIVGTWRGAMALGGTITAHRTRDTPCGIDSPCEACAVMARSRGINTGPVCE